MPKPDKQIIIDELIKELEGGSNYTTSLAKVGGKWRIPSRTFDRYWKTANEQHIIKQDGIKKELAVIDTAAALKARKRAIMTAEDRKEWLTKIIMKDLKVMKVGGSTQMVHEYTDKDGKILTEIISYDHKLKALAELNKMEGDYSPTKIANTNTKGEDIEPQVFIINGKEIKF